MSKVLLSMLFLSLSALACNLSQSDEPDPTPIALILPTASPAATNTPPPTATTTSSETSSTSNTTTSSNSASSSSNHVVNDVPIIGTNQSAAIACSVKPTGNFNVNIRNNNNLNASVVAKLGAGRWIPVSYHNNGWFQISEPGSRYDKMWISDDPVTLTQPCNCTPNCTSQFDVPPTPMPAATWQYSGPTSACKLTQEGNLSQAVYTERNTNQGIIGEIPAGGFTYAFSIRDGWFKVWEPISSQYGWVVLGVMLREDTTTCFGLPVESDPKVTACTAINSAGDTIGIQGEPNYDSVFILRMAPGMSVNPIGIEGDWIKVYLTASKHGFEGEGWIEKANLFFEGDCTTFFGE